MTSTYAGRNERALTRGVAVVSTPEGGVPFHKPTVAILAHGINDCGGMERAFAELIRRGHHRYNFVVFAVRLDEELQGLVRWHRVRVPMRPATLLTPLFALVAGVWLARVRVDLVHTQGAIVPNRVDLATVHFCHVGHRELIGRYAPVDAPLARRLNTGLARRFAVLAECWCYRPRRVRTLAVVSPGVAREVRRHYPAVPLVVTPNGVDLDRFHPDAEVRRTVREEHGVAENEIVILFVGGDWDRKGVSIVIEGVAEARRTASKDLRLWIVGRGDERRFRSIAEDCDIRDRVTFMGSQARTERFYQAADIFAVATMYETFSLVAYEAAASGLPIVATRVSGIEDLVGDEEAGLTVERTASSVGAALSRLAEDDVLRQRLGVEALRRAALFTWQRSVDCVLTAYDAILAGSGIADAQLAEAAVR